MMTCQFMKTLGALKSAYFNYEIIVKFELLCSISSIFRKHNFFKVKKKLDYTRSINDIKVENYLE